MRNPLLITATAIALTTAVIANEELTLENVRAMSDDELYALAETLSAEDETRLYQQARNEFPKNALGLQSALNKLAKRRDELDACENSIESGEPSTVRALNEIEPGRYLSILRIVSIPSNDVMDMTPAERKDEAREAGRETNRVLRDFRECKRKYRKLFEGG